MAFEEDLVDWVGTSTAAQSRVFMGSRLQSTALPAVVLEVNGGRAATLSAATGSDLDQWEVAVRGVADDMASARNLAVAAVAAITTNVDTGSVVYQPEYRLIEEPSLGQGDEAEPAICTANIVILHRK